MFTKVEGRYRKLNSKLSDHTFKKGKFITPFNHTLGNIAVNEPWSLDRLPEYVWMALILDYYGRSDGLEKCMYILRYLSSNHKEISSPKFSSILNLDSRKQCLLYDYIMSVIDPSILSPLSIVYTYSNYPEFSKCFCNTDKSVKQRITKLVEVLMKYFHQQSNEVTDIKYLVISYDFLLEKLTFAGIQQEYVKLLSEYSLLEHSNEKMKLIGSIIRSLELSAPLLEGKNKLFIEKFWKDVSMMSECELIGVNFAKEESNADDYMKDVQGIIRYLSELLKADNPLSNKMLVLLGIATYSFKRVLEIVDHKLYNTITARGSIRNIIENYIMMKYLLENEKDHIDIWTDFQLYGIGLYKLVLTKSRDIKRDLSKSHVEYKYLDLLVNEYIMEEYIDMDTSYFDNQGIRDKAISVGERELYGLYYDYDSSFEHGFWGAIRESSLLKCQSPAHQLHCVPDYENKQNLKSVWYDCIYVMNKTIHLLHDIYPIPQHLLNKVDGYAE